MDAKAARAWEAALDPAERDALACFAVYATALAERLDYPDETLVAVRMAAMGEPECARVHGAILQRVRDWQAGALDADLDAVRERMTS